ncbi:hypothetical protein niasHT_013308 [Heterodera trifolii]|uniref:Uncharacterized protein n=1 Tax=Heterodera trifolii TaxID=157864 RepID=A0ABD2LAS4_9BILA
MGVAGVGCHSCPSGRLPPNIQIFPSIILICQRGTAARHGSGRSQQRHHPQVRFSSFATLVRFQFVNSGDASQIRFSPFAIFIHFIMPFIAPGTFAFLSKDYGEFSTGQFDPNRAYEPNSLAQLS